MLMLSHDMGRKHSWSSFQQTKIRLNVGGENKKDSDEKHREQDERISEKKKKKKGRRRKRMRRKKRWCRAEE